ncbi:MAG TPA: AI-2E family transporter [Puia sp.]|nr:AI-2E family transporter [Puia sp.]
MESDNSAKKDLSYPAKVWQTTAVICLFISIILILRVAFNILLMALAGVLIAVYFHGLADLIEMRFKLRRKFAVLISIFATLIFLFLLMWFIGAKIQSQISELSDTLPKTIISVKEKLSKTLVGQKMLKYSSGDNSQKILDTATAFFSTSFGVAGDLYIIIFFGIFFTIDPSSYKKGILFLFPPNKKDVAKIILSRISISLKAWLKSILVSMALITIFVAVGLAIAGLPATLVLGLITGLLEIVPNFGPIIAMIPGVLLAITIGVKTAVVVTLVYIICQTLVESIITPLIQKRIIHLPPALTLMSQLIMGTLSGVIGIILAIPVLSILIICIDELYVKRNNPELNSP